jgi:plastocyanin
MQAPLPPEVFVRKDAPTVNPIRILLRRGALAATAVALLTLIAACSPSAEGTAGEGTGGGTIAVTNGNVDLSADDLAFDASTIEAPAGEAFTITFTNLESQPHNVAVLTEEGGDEIVRGEVITGPDAEDVVEVPALEPGEYYFLCDVHPDMNGTIVVEG